MDEEIYESIKAQNEIRKRLWIQQIKKEKEKNDPLSNILKINTKDPIDDLPEDFNCPICYEPMLDKENPPITLYPCGHTICQNCLFGYAKQKLNEICPFCNKPYDNRVVNHTLMQIGSKYTSNEPDIDFEQDREEAESKLELLILRYEKCTEKIKELEGKHKVMKTVLSNLESVYNTDEKECNAVKEKLDEKKRNGEALFAERKKLREICESLKLEQKKIYLEKKISG